MACEDCIGLILISVVSLLISINLFRRYSKIKNKFTLYMAFFFLAAGLGWLIWFLNTEWVFGTYELYKNYLIFLGVIPQLILLIFILAFFEVRRFYIVSVVIVILIVFLIHIIFPEFRLLTISAVCIISANIVLFLVNWRKNQDIKSVFFALGLLFILIGEALTSISSFLHGIFLIITAILWGLTYSGLLERFLEK